MLGPDIGTSPRALSLLSEQGPELPEQGPEGKGPVATGPPNTRN